MTQSPANAETVQVEQLLALISQCWDVLQKELDQVPDDRKAVPGACGVWSVKDLVGHIAMVDEYEAQKLEQAVGKPGVEVEDITWQEQNDREAATRASHSMTELETELAQSHAHLLAAIQSLAGAEPALVAAQLAELPENTCDHYDEHSGQIRAWRERSDA